MYHIIRKLKDLTYFRRLCGQKTFGQATLVIDTKTRSASFVFGIRDELLID